MNFSDFLDFTIGGSFVIILIYFGRHLFIECGMNPYISVIVSILCIFLAMLESL